MRSASLSQAERAHKKETTHMTKTFNATLLAAALLFAALPAHAQTMLTQTTLSAAVTSSSTRNMVVAAGTGITAGTTGIYVDREFDVVTACSPACPSSSATTLTLQRGASGTAAGTHASGALVFVGPLAAFNQNPRVNAPTNGSCTRGNELYLPLINVSTGIVSDCLGGQWIKGLVTSGATTAARFRVYAPEPGGTAYTAINTNGTTLGATTLYCSEVWLATSKNLTGIALLNGTTVGTDNHYVVLYDSGGTAIANSALAGAVAASASAYQEFAFTSKYFAVGPAQYFACFQTNGTTATVRMGVTGTNDNYLTKGQTAATFGTVPALTVPTTFTTAVGPYVYLY